MLFVPSLASLPPSSEVGDASVVGPVFLIFLAVELAVDWGRIVLSIIY